MKTVRSIFDTGTITKEIVTRGTNNIVYLRVVLNETPPTTIEINEHPVALTDIVSTTAFLQLQDDDGVNLPADSTGDTLEGYKNTTLNQVIVFGIGGATSPNAVYRYELTADKI